MVVYQAFEIFSNSTHENKDVFGFLNLNDINVNDLNINNININDINVNDVNVNDIKCK
jgi:hypothetical protein